MNLIKSIIIIGCVALLVGCSASVPPPELVDARRAYARANAGQAAQLVPAEVHKARVALAEAEKSFENDPMSWQTRDLSYIADRKAKMAEALAVTVAEQASSAQANKDYQATQAEIMKITKEDLAVSERVGELKSDQLAASQRSGELKSDQLAASERTAELKAKQLAAEQAARIDAERRVSVAQDNLVKLAAVKEEARGLVITLSGSVLFASGQWSLFTAAQDRLNKVTEALMETKGRKLTVEGHTDSQGSSSYNQALSQRRADAVRSYIISRGYPSDLIQARGIGEDRPIADNASVEGRANNRRVEIVVAK